ncbi:hypothetical protein BJ741DRAFT_596832 [Chytriomyces cf. hyalinus JEL632]|nr:hypothetical protein BJ741DRAFT_596832 [Chytriomyces cf. hyalinus JEL632]
MPPATETRQTQRKSRCTLHGWKTRPLRHRCSPCRPRPWTPASSRSSEGRSRLAYATRAAQEGDGSFGDNSGCSASWWGTQAADQCLLAPKPTRRGVPEGLPPIHAGLPMGRHPPCRGSPDAPVSTAKANEMLQATLRAVRAFQGETLYGFRVGGAVAAALDPNHWAEVRAAGGWRTSGPWLPPMRATKPPHWTWCTGGWPHGQNSLILHRIKYGSEYGMRLKGAQFYP